METQTRIEQIERAIEKLKSIESISSFDCFTGEYDPKWNYYYSLSGFLNEQYFSVYITKHTTDSIEYFSNQSDKEIKEEITELIQTLLQDE